jgi:uncharacterized membrane protein
MKRRTNPLKHPPNNLSFSVPKNLDALVESKAEELLRQAFQEGGLGQRMIQQTIVHQSTYSGPLPQPEETAKYEVIFPGFTERFITMAEFGQKAEVTAVARRDKYTLIYKILGLLLAGILGICPIIGGIFLLYAGKRLEGFSSIGLAVGIIVIAIVYGRLNDSTKS